MQGIIAKRTVSLLFIFIFATVLSGCSLRLPTGSSFADDHKIHVVTSIFSAYDFAREIGGEYVNVRLLLKPGCEVHTYEPTPRDIISIEKCDIFICVGGENDTWVEKILGAINNPDLVVLRMTDLALTLYEEEDEGDEGDEESDEIEWDEHVWMDADNAVAICSGIADAYSNITPAYSESFSDNLKRYSKLLYEIDQNISTIVESASRRTMIFADRFPARYFAERYGLDCYAAFPGCAESTEPSAATVAFLVDKTRSEAIPEVIYIEMGSGRLAEVVSEETGAEIETFYVGHNVTADEFRDGLTFIDMLRHDAEVLKRALN